MNHGIFRVYKRPDCSSPERAMSSRFIIIAVALALVHTPDVYASRRANPHTPPMQSMAEALPTTPRTTRAVQKPMPLAAALPTTRAVKRPMPLATTLSAKKPGTNDVLRLNSERRFVERPLRGKTQFVERSLQSHGTEAISKIKRQAEHEASVRRSIQQRQEMLRSKHMEKTKSGFFFTRTNEFH